MRCPKTFVAILCAVCVTGFTALGAGKPNVLLILSDDMGFSDLGCYGSEIATPNLDALAKNGLRFTQCYNTARCWPSRGCIMTGYYAQQIRRDTLPDIPSGARGARPDWAPLVSKILQPTGYRCYHSGKWHIDGSPFKNGFDHSYDVGGQDNYFKSSGNIENGKIVEQTPDYYSTTAIAGHAIKCLKEHAEKFSDRPFFHYLCFTAPHFPLQAPAADIAKYEGTYLVGWNVIAQQRFARMTKMGLVHNALPPVEREVGPPYHFPDALLKLGPDEVNHPLPWKELSKTQQEFQAAKMAIHAAMIDRIDQEIGRVIAQLKAMGAYDNTLILFASDNGASAEIMVRGDGHDTNAPPGSAKSYLCLGPGWSSAANTPLRRHKTWVHEGGISTPLIVHWPAGIAARGELRNNPVHFIDVVPTVLEVTGVEKPTTINEQPVPPAPGKSLVSVFKKDGTVSHDFLWWLHEDNRAIRVGDWKLVAAAHEPWELYNLATDRGESHNLVEKHPEKLRELSALWDKQAAATRVLALRDLPPSNAEKKTKPKLR